MDRESTGTYRDLSPSRWYSCAPSDSSPGRAGNPPRIRILIVEDDPDHREILHSLLDSLGYVCEEASDGQEGLDKLDHSPFDLVMTDYQMPQMNGIEFIHTVRTTMSLSTIPLILVTGHTDPKVMDHARSVGATSILAKPFSLKNLQEILDQLFP